MLCNFKNAMKRMKIALASTSIQRIGMFKTMDIPVEVIGSKYAEDLDRSAFTPRDFVQLTALGKAIDVFKSHTELDIIIAADTMVVAPLSNDTSASKGVTTAAHIIGQPKDAEDARDMLTRLSGNVHHVVTGVAILIRSSDKSALQRIRSQSKDSYWFDGDQALQTETSALSDLVREWAPRIIACSKGSECVDASLPEREAKESLGGGKETDAVLLSFSHMTSVEFEKLSREVIDAYIETGEPFGRAGSYAIQGQAGSFVKSIQGCHNNVIGFPLSLFCVKFAALLEAMDSK